MHGGTNSSGCGTSAVKRNGMNLRSRSVTANASRRPGGEPQII